MKCFMHFKIIKAEVVDFSTGSKTLKREAAQIGQQEGRGREDNHHKKCVM